MSRKARVALEIVQYLVMAGAILVGTDGRFKLLAIVIPLLLFGPVWAFSFLRANRNRDELGPSRGPESENDGVPTQPPRWENIAKSVAFWLLVILIPVAFIHFTAGNREVMLMLAPIIFGAAAAIGALWWLERFTKHAGLMNAIAGTVALLFGGFRLVTSPGLLPALFVLQGIFFLGLYHSRRSLVRAERRAALDLQAR